MITNHLFVICKNIENNYPFQMLIFYALESAKYLVHNYLI